jgi:hypothetical protein
MNKKTENEIIKLLKTTKLSYREIGLKFNMSRSPVDKIIRKHNIKRNNIRKTNDSTCYMCGKVFYVPVAQKRHGRGRFCSKECYRLWQKSEENKGENHPNYIDGGSESKLNLLRKTDEWKQWREKVYTRDNYTCQVCGRRGHKLHPHHVLKKSLYPDLIFDCRNGITLCEDCHGLPGIHEGEFGWLRLYEKINEAQLMHLR